MQQAIKKKPTWRLSRTLKRASDVSPIEEEHIKYLWAAYKKGALSDIFDGTDLNARDFKNSLEDIVLSNFDAAWIISCNEDDLPCGLVLGNWHPLKDDVMFISMIAWFPWATKRNIVEGTIRFLDDVRKELSLIGYASMEHKNLYDVAARHGVVRRVGTTHNFKEEPVAIYETKQQQQQRSKRS